MRGYKLSDEEWDSIGQQSRRIYHALTSVSQCKQQCEPFYALRRLRRKWDVLRCELDEVLYTDRPTNVSMIEGRHICKVFYGGDDHQTLPTDLRALALLMQQFCQLDIVQKRRIGSIEKDVRIVLSLTD